MLQMQRAIERTFSSISTGFRAEDFKTWPIRSKCAGDLTFPPIGMNHEVFLCSFIDLLRSFDKNVTCYGVR